MSDNGYYIIAVDRFNPIFNPPSYSVAGYTLCSKCQAECVLGHGVYDILSEGTTFPVCKQCIEKLQLERAERVDEIVDPEVCPDCGEKHLPVMPANMSYLN